MAPTAAASRLTPSGILIRLFAVARYSEKRSRWMVRRVKAMYRTITTVANGKVKVCRCDTLTEGHDIASQVTAAY